MSTRHAALRPNPLRIPMNLKGRLMKQQLFSNPIRSNVKTLLILTPMMLMLKTVIKRKIGEEENAEEIIDLSRYWALSFIYSIKFTKFYYIRLVFFISPLLLCFFFYFIVGAECSYSMLKNIL
jgi:hypothetical protein